MRLFWMATILTASAALFVGPTHAGEGAAATGRIQLPAPAKSGGVPLNDALAARKSDRAFADVELAPQQLSDLLWATAGANRESGRTTYPVARGRKDMTLFVFTKAGVFRYDPANHALDPVEGVTGDKRADTGTQPFVAQAAVNLVFVHDASFWEDSRERAENWGFVHAGAMMQNAYLHAAAMDWSAVVRGLFDGDKLKALLNLPPKQRVLLTQSIGPRG